MLLSPTTFIYGIFYLRKRNNVQENRNGIYYPEIKSYRLTVSHVWQGRETEPNCCMETELIYAFRLSLQMKHNYLNHLPINSTNKA